MTVRGVVSKHLDRVLRVAGPISLLLLIGNLSLTLTEHVAWRGGAPELWATGLALALVVAVVLLANLWTTKLDMVRGLRSAGVIHDPMQVYQFTPREVALWRVTVLQEMKWKLAMGRKQGLPEAELASLSDAIRRFEAWIDLGYIPRDEFPSEYLGHYIFAGGRA